MQKHGSWQGASETEWQEACRRESAIRSLIESGPVSHARADVVAKDLGISRALVYRLASRYRLRAQTSSLLPFRRGRAPRSRLLDPEVEALILHSGGADLFAARTAAHQRPSARRRD